MTVRIRPARPADLDRLLELRRSCLETAPSDASDPAVWLSDLINEGCVLAGVSSGALVASSALDPASATILETLVTPDFQRQGLGRQLVDETEQLATEFGILNLTAEANPSSVPFLEACGYQTDNDNPLRLQRQITHRLNEFGRHIATLLAELGIPAHYGQRHRLRLQQECTTLVSIGSDRFQRPQSMMAGAAQAWLEMQQEARSDGIELEAISAFRSVDYQAGIIRRKLDVGQAMEDILAVSAAPGFSEHHSGRAIDIALADGPPLETSFEETDGFAWLCAAAHRFGFRMSYPRDNRHGILYEPWHWYFTGQPD